MTDFRLQYVIKTRLLLKENFAVAILDANNRVRRRANAIIGKCGVGTCEIERTHIRGSQGDRGIGRNIGTNPKFLRKFYHIRYRCKFLNRMERCKIDRLFERKSNADRAALEFSSEIVRMPGANRDWLIRNTGLRRRAVLENRGIYYWLER